MEINEIYSGFRLVKKTKISELDANLLEFKHEKSGGTLAYIECNDLKHYQMIQLVCVILSNIRFYVDQKNFHLKNHL